MFEVIPSAMESLRLVDSSSSSLSIAWNIPHNLQLFPSGLEYSVSYAILADWANSSQYHVIWFKINLLIKIKTDFSMAMLFYLESLTEYVMCCYQEDGVCHVCNVCP